MESIQSGKFDAFMHAQDLKMWLSADCGLTSVRLQPMTGDASQRHYFRVYTDTTSYVAMDTSKESTHAAFVAIAKALRAQQLQVPEIIHYHAEKGFLLLTDFGDATYLSILTAQNATVLYQHAIDALIQLQHCQSIPNYELPAFQIDVMWQEWLLYKTWFLSTFLQCHLAPDYEKNLDKCMRQVIEQVAQQPQVLMHRDYHSANLMQLQGFTNATGILDFQDAFIGPITYDLVSLLRDCYIDWPESMIKELLHYYFLQAKKTNLLTHQQEHEFYRWMNWMGVQRHFKTLLTFARKQCRDQQSRYLQFIPRTLNYLLLECNDPALLCLRSHVQTILPLVRERISLCAQ